MPPFEELRERVPRDLERAGDPSHARPLLIGAADLRLPLCAEARLRRILPALPATGVALVFLLAVVGVTVPDEPVTATVTAQDRDLNHGFPPPIR